MAKRKKDPDGDRVIGKVTGTPSPPIDSMSVEKGLWIWTNNNQALGEGRTAPAVVAGSVEHYIDKVKNSNAAKAKGGKAPKGRAWIIAAMRDCYDGKMTAPELWDFMHKNHDVYTPWSPPDDEDGDVKVYADRDSIVQVVPTRTGATQTASIKIGTFKKYLTKVRAQVT